MPGEDPAHAVKEGKHDEEMEDGRDGMPGAGQLPCNDHVDAVEQAPQNGGSAAWRLADWAKECPDPTSPIMGL